jgi:hypothetical protein
LLKESREKIRSDSHFIRGYTRYLDTKSRERFIDLKKTNDTIRSLLTEKKTGGRRLTQAAAVLLAIPDPVTDAAAVPVFIAAQMMKMRSRKESEMQRIMNEANSSLSSLLYSARLSFA